MKRILFIDDQQAELEYYHSFLSKKFIIDLEREVFCYEDWLRTQAYDAIILDIHMDIMDGFQARKKILNSPFYNQCPIVFKTSYTSDENIIKGLSTKCEFITPDMKAEQILLRIENQIENHHIKRFGRISLNLIEHTFISESEIIDLTENEFNILRILFLNNFSITRQQLIDKIWKKAVVMQNTINTHIYNTRKKIEPFGVTIVATRGEGYFLEDIS